MSELPNHIIKKIEQYMKHSHKANKLRNEIDDWFVSKGVDSINVDSYGTESYDIDGATIQNILTDASQGTETSEKDIDNIIRLINLNYYPIKG